ncbi:MAG TPA: hypothetical protein VH475_20985 [Tepidisphaeraceae bacterium]|jgi:hypothetical protein
MLPDAVNHELARDPFVPLRIFVADGHSYVVRNPNLCLITRGALYIARTDRLHSRLADDMDVIDVRHITRIEQFVEDQRATA